MMAVDQASSIADIVGRIRARLEALGLAARRASVVAGLGDSGIRNLFRAADEGEPYSPRIDTMIGIAKALQVDPSWLMFGTARPQPMPFDRHAASIPALHQPEIRVERSSDSPRAIEIRQGDAVVIVLDCFVEDLIAALQRAGR